MEQMYLTERDKGVLEYLAARPEGVSVGDGHTSAVATMADELPWAYSTVAATCRSLEAAGHVHRRSFGGKVTHVVITDSGRSLVHAVSNHNPTEGGMTNTTMTTTTPTTNGPAAPAPAAGPELPDGLGEAVLAAAADAITANRTLRAELAAAQDEAAALRAKQAEHLALLEQARATIADLSQKNRDKGGRMTAGQREVIAELAAALGIDE